MVASYDDLNTGTRDGNISDFSSRGQPGQPNTYPDIAAPGSNITSACRPYLIVCSTGLDPRNGPGTLDIGTFNTISGTSMATPHVVGIVAQLFQRNPNATAAQIENAVKSTAYKFPSWAEHEAGAGLIDAYAAAQAL
jgi:serine protease AprX